MNDDSILECAVDHECVSFLDGPADFYNWLCTGFRGARSRVVLACLYVGCGELESKLLECIVAAKKRNPKLTIDILVDKARTSRLGLSGAIVSPLTQLQPYLGGNHGTTVSLFHNPLLGRLLSKIFKSPYCEAFGTMHIKIYIADDDCIITGANAGRDYFVDRYDRYMLVKDPLFSDLMHTFIKTYQSASFTLTKDLTTEWISDMVNPLDDNMLFRKQLYIRTQQMVRMCEDVLRKNSLKRKKHHSENTAKSPRKKRVVSEKYGQTHGFTGDLEAVDNTGTENGCYCYIKICLHLPFTKPAFMQGVNMLEEWLLGYAKEGFSTFIATAYLNFTDRYVNMFKEILKFGLQLGKPTPLQVVTSSPYANSFYKDGHLKRMVALCYSTAATWLFNGLKQDSKYPDDIYMEYNRPNHTFHAKGIWILKDRLPLEAAHTSEAQFDACVEPPCATVIGSSNYGKRSYDKDMEITMLVETNSPRIRKFMRRELYGMLKYSEYVPYETVKERLGPSQYVVSRIMNSFL
ncbi:phosphatidylglycerophosphate synthase domain containing protein [Babesia bovis T2Bo]|uniref:CDP-diacylglycerol--glycerol-3-phosphate 3-phosphatidyltransferase n=1 Tax=Babesia bovis TaxID=5865 RepID=A7ASL2_BABBO|nr:phosphatidylglycerophosphate synthase domain containing protein [Babesia bovis T2Bo]EDO07531.1 phosphatidylglycerophosphate synthase domain containing protein [Babesia bovis T2Bo]|eukprot:XP_001611099.1 phosphatidylglycerophosphate synthase [Babesia bovis T2Bo]